MNRKSLLVTLLLTIIPVSFAGENEHKADGGGVPYEDPFQTQPVYEARVPAFDQSANFGNFPDSSGPVFETMEPELTEITNVTNTSIYKQNSREPLKNSCANLPSGDFQSSYPKDSIEYKILSHEERRANVISQLMNKHGLSAIGAERRDPEFFEVAECDGGYQKQQCFALLRRSVTDAEQAKFEGDPSHKNLDIEKSWSALKSIITTNPGTAKSDAIAASLNLEKTTTVINFVAAADAEDATRLQVSAEAIGMIDLALAMGNGEEAKILLTHLKAINPSAAEALNCLVSDEDWEAKSYDLSQVDQTKDKVGPITGTVFYKYDETKQQGIVPLLIGGGAVAAEAAAGTALASAASAALVKSLTVAGVAAGAVFLSDNYERGPSGVWAPSGSWGSSTSAPSPGPSKEPSSEKLKWIAVGAVVGEGVKKVGQLIDFVGTKIGEAAGWIEPKNAEEPKAPIVPTDGNLPGNGNPKSVDPEPLQVDIEDEKPEAVKETDYWFEQAKKEMASWRESDKTFEIMQELSIYHFANDSADAELQDSTQFCELTEQQNDELVKLYVDDYFMEKLLETKPIDFTETGWNNLPEDRQQACAVVDP